MRYVLATLSITITIAFASTSAAQVDDATIARIIDEALNHSELPQTAAYLTDRIGGRVTNSPQMREAEKWTQERFRGWGLENVRAEAFDFGRGWSIERIEARMLTPRVLPMQAIPIAWTPSTQGTINAPVIVAPLRRERDFDKWKGQLAGKIVLVERARRRLGAGPGAVSPPDGRGSRQARHLRAADALGNGDRARTATLRVRGETRRVPGRRRRARVAAGVVSRRRAAARRRVQLPRGRDSRGARHRARGRGLSPARAAREDGRRADRRAHEHRALPRRRTTTPTTSSPRFRVATRRPVT